MSEQKTDKLTNVDTGGGGFVGSNVSAGGDAYLGAKNVGFDEVHGNKFVYQIGHSPWQPLPVYTPPPPPDPSDVPGPGALPPGSRIPFGRNPLFTGRDEDLRQLAALLLPYSDHLTNPSLITISTGIGGIGKTQLAVEFAHRYGRFFHSVHWVSMTDPAAVEGEIIDCGLEMALFPPGGAVDRATQFGAIRRAWALPEARLLIFDNCEDPALLAEWKPKSGGCRILVTSRNIVWPPELGAHQQPIDLLPRLQSVLLLREYLVPASREEKDEVLDSVADEVGDLPLALALAGHYLARYRSESVTDYLAKLGNAAELLPVARGGFSPTGHDLSVWNTFAVSYNKLDSRDEVDDTALNLIARATCFAPGEPLPELLLLATMSGSAPHLLEDALSLGSWSWVFWSA